jgi:hypothetical protein
MLMNWLAVAMSRQPSRARTVSQSARRGSISGLEHGVGNRNIRVLHQDPIVGQRVAVDGGESGSGATSPKRSISPSSIQQDRIRPTPCSGKSSSTMAEPTAAEGYGRLYFA